MIKYPVCRNKIKDPECAAKTWHSQINYKTKETPGGGWASGIQDSIWGSPEERLKGMM